MSSFIVSKREFIKAAGLMCGYESARRNSHKWFIENVRKEFEHAYALNVLSVNEQYGDNEAPEEGDFDDVFDAYRKEGALIYTEGYAGTVIMEKVKEDVMDKREFRRCMWTFFDSVLYQIENEAAHRAVSELFYMCLNKLYADETHGVEGWWGEIELKAA